MKTIVCSYLTLPPTLNVNPYQHNVIIFTDSHINTLPNKWVEKSKDVCHLQIDDIDKPVGSFIAPSLKWIAYALAWAEYRDNIVCACAAGVSRSSAMAYLVEYQRNGPTKALELLDPKTHKPNRLIIKLGAEILEEDSVWNHFQFWKELHFSKGNQR